MIDLSHRMLRIGGALEITAAADASSLIRDALAESAFDSRYMREFSPPMRRRSDWTRHFESQGLEILRHTARKIG